MKILQVCNDPYRETGGVVMHVRNISERLAKKHDVTVYATNRGLKFPMYEVINGVNVERFNCYAPGEAYYFSVDMLLRLRKVKFNVVHAHNYHAFPFHFAVEAKRDKLIATPHFHGVGHTTFRNSLLKLLKIPAKRVFKEANAIIAVSEYEKSLLQKEFHLGADRIEVIPNGVDYFEFSGLKKHDLGYKPLLYVGYLIGFKGAQYLVEVLPKLEKDVVLEIVGRGPMRPLMEKRARDLGVFDRVRFYQDLSRRELLQKFADADALALLSAHEAYSIVVAEALTAGTPCIVANASALEEWIDNESCFGVDLPINLNDLAKVTNYVLKNGVDKGALMKWQGTKIFDWNEVTARLETLYQRCQK